MLLWAFYQMTRSTPISQGNGHMESQPSKDQTKSPGRHRNARESAGKLTLFDSANGVWKWVDWKWCPPRILDLGNHGMNDGFLSPQSFIVKNRHWSLSMKRCLPTRAFCSHRSQINYYIYLDSRNHNIEPQIELESIDAQPRAMGSNLV